MDPSRVPARLRRGAGAVFGFSSVFRVLLAIGSDLRLVAVADGQQHFLRVIEIAALLPVVLENSGLDDRVHRAALLAEAAEDALGEVDVVAGGAARPVSALLGLDRDRERRADRLAELAGDAALLAVRVATQRVQSAKARTLRRLLFRELHGHLARKHEAAGQEHSAPELARDPCVEEIPDSARQ